MTQQLRRSIDGSPAHVLTYVRETPAMSPDDQVGWLFLTHQQELDEAGEMVRAWVDGLTVEELVAIGRELADRDLDLARQRVAEAKLLLDIARVHVQDALVTRAALDHDDPEKRQVAMRMAEGWLGTVDDLHAAVEAVTD